MENESPPAMGDGQRLTQEIKRLAPWHMDIELDETTSTGRVFSETGRIPRKTPGEISIISPKQRFLSYLDLIYPHGLRGKRFLDCACNSGGYCFWIREHGAAAAVGFDVREHWIRQAQFVQQHRTLAPTDGLEFFVCDLYDLAQRQLPPFDITMFKGIFYHLPDPISGLKIAADLTREVLLFNSAMTWDQPDGSLKLAIESTEHLMSGVHGLAWYPTGPEVVADILTWMGFVDARLILQVQNEYQPHLGRMELIAARHQGLLDRLPGERLLARSHRRPRTAA